MRARISLFLPLLLSPLAACLAAPPGTPEEMANTLLTELEAGRVDDARELFARVERDEEYREKIYPVLFGAARDRHQAGNSSGAAVLLRFLHEGYPGAASVREALLYALFLERAEKEAPEPAVSAEIAKLLEEIRAGNGTIPVWVDLIEAQQGIDRGDQALAREAYARFLGAWDGRPSDPELVVYVEDIGRYLSRGGR